MTNKGNLSGKERALIEAARHELAAKTTTPRIPAPVQQAGTAAAPAPLSGALTAPVQLSGAATAPAQSPGAATAPAQTAPLRPQAPPPAAGATPPAPDKAAPHAARIATLMAAERAETQRRRDKMKRWGIHFPMALFTLVLAWLALRQFA